MHWKIRCSVVLAGVLLAASAEAARVTQVRVGDHAKFTRIVVELDAPATYSWEKNAASGVSELVLDVDASTATRVITSRSRLVESVALRPGAGGAVARVQLRGGDVQVKEMLLKAPYRIVLDVSAAAPRVAAQPPAPPEPAPVAPAPRTVVADAGDALDEAEEVAEAARAAAAEEAEAQARAALEAAAAAEAEAEAQSRSDEQDIASADEASDDSVEEAMAADEDPFESRSDPDRMAAASGEAPEEAEAAPVAASGGDGGSGMGLTLALVGVAILLLALLAVRRRSERIAREAAAAPWPPPGAEERPEFATAIADEEAPHVPGAPEAHGPLFGGGGDARAEDDAEPVVAADAEPEPEPAPSGAPAAAPIVPVGLRAEPEVVAKEDAHVVEELERRIERLEARLSDSLDARERLERQLAAHTEELRVQRAAIARTQRAVRAAVRGPEAAADEPTAASPISGPGSTGSADH